MGKRLSVIGLLIACVLALVAGCTYVIEVLSVDIDKATIDLQLGQTATVNATIIPADATCSSVEWRTGTDNVILVSPDGSKNSVATIQANSVGTTTLVAYANGIASQVCTVVVRKVEVSEIRLNKSAITITEGETSPLTATVSPDNATDQEVTWSSSNNSVASVSSDGLVTAKAEGTATITAKSTDGSKSASCTVTVKAKVIAVTSVSLNRTSLSLTAGDSYTLTATVNPTNATDKTVNWSSSNTSVATVSNYGLVTAKAAGTATITVRTSDGGKTATCTVTVNPAVVNVTSVSLSRASLTLTAGDTYTLTATVSPTNATDKTVSWSSSNNTVATVSSSGLVTAKSAGNATITVRTTDGGKTATCSVTVNPAVVNVTSVSLDRTSLTLTEGDTHTLTASVSPSNATDKSVSWGSSNNSVATVNASGKVTAVAEGSATITVRTTDGNKTATCTVTVNPLQAYDGQENGLRYVDLGLPSGIKWATCNVGADNPQDYGNYFAWGEISSKSNYSWSTHKYANGSNTQLTKYNYNSSYGTVDNRTVLELTDDAAHSWWGGSWRMPTKAEFDELLNPNNCTTEWTTMGGVYGRKVTSRRNTSKSIFLPAAGRYNGANLSEAGANGSYWCADLNSMAPDVAQYCRSGNGSIGTSSDSRGRILGQSVRPVTDKNVRISVSGLSLNKSKIELTPGESTNIAATVTPSNATQPAVIWSSSDPTVATVSYTGKVTAVAAGTISIIDKTYDGGYTSTCAVTVKIPVTSVSVSPANATIYVGSNQQLTATVSPSNATDKSVTWSSSNTSVATVSAYGLVTAKAAGSATITATTTDGGKKATCAVTVKVSTVPVTSVSLDKTSISLYENYTYQLTATVNPSNASDKTVSWTSSNSSVATVSSTGLVTAKATGNATITVRTSDGGKTATCAVAVVQLNGDGIENGHEYVDLGLPSGLKWATCNVGATTPEGYGEYYAWGEVSPKSQYMWGNYSLCNYGEKNINKYNYSSSTGPVVDKKSTLVKADDAASSNWGGKWRMPTYEEMGELTGSRCTWTWTSQGGINGYRVTGPNGKSIFLPASGYKDAKSFYEEGTRGYYWTSSVDESYCPRANYLYFYYSNGNHYSRLQDYRYEGLSVRPVFK